MHRTARRALVLIVALGSATAGCGGNAQPISGDAQPISVMTRNLYLGADLAPLLSALSPQNVTALAGGIWRDIQASNFPERAVVLAGEIVRTDPDVVALQEVSLYRIQTPGDWQSEAPPNATDVALDFLELLLAEISLQGGHYHAVSIGLNADEELPATDLDGTSFDIRLTDRDVILVKLDDELTFATGPGETFPTVASVHVGGAGGAFLEFRRGFITADVTVRGKTVRVVDSHLEVGGLLGPLQEHQASELLAALGPMRGPMILAGDFNSPADGSGTSSYALLTTTSGSPAPFRDSWQSRQGVPTPDAGAAEFSEFTCCMALAAAMPLPRARIDLVLSRGGVQSIDASLITPTRTPSGLWPSDHLGVAARLQIP